MKSFKHISLIFIFFFIAKLSIGQVLSPYSEISVITCAPGNELYSTFGHSAIRIKDPVLRIDKVYNYGTFNFETPNFYMKFIRGKLDYMLSVSPYRYFVMAYIQEKRSVNEQVLDLSYNQKKKIYLALKENALPKNRYYRYDFLKDNCSTRVLKKIKDALQDSLILPENLKLNNNTYREMLIPYLQEKNWERFGINLALGRPSDKTLTTKEAAFLPDYLKLILDNAAVNKNGKLKSFIKQENVLYEARKTSVTDSLMITPSRLFWLLLILILSLSIFEIKYNKSYLILDKTLFFIIGLIGLNILFLWFGTDHSATALNQNILWASPFLFFAAFSLKKKNNNLLKIYFLIQFIIIISGFFADLFVINLFDKAIIPLELILIIRTLLTAIRK